MFKKIFKSRLDVFSLIALLIFAVILFRLADIQIVHGKEYKKKAETRRMKNIPVVAPRGNIADRYGRVLAGNQLSYSVNLLKTDVPDDTINEIILSVLNIIEKNGDTYKDEIPIKINPIQFTFTEDEANWKLKYNIPPTATAQEAFNKLRVDFGISADSSDVEAYEALKDLNVEIPFNLKDFQYKYKKDEIDWKKKNKFDENIGPEEAFSKLLDKYEISRQEYNDDQAKKILAIKYLLGKNIFKLYEPVEIALNIKDQTRAQIEENKIFLPGVEIIEKPIRKYYEGETACHIIGYMGKIGDELDQMVSKGYTPQDVIGKQGIEYSMESYLKGTNGTKQIEVDVKGTLINTIDEVDPTPGDTVFLNIDSKLQKVAQEALKTTMAQIVAGDASQGFTPFKNATSGAVVAMDPNTGRILAMASEPQFDPSLFASGISTENWQLYQPKTKNIYEPKPLINNAISAVLPPGSTMKMVAGMAGLENNKVSPTEIIVDKGLYTAVPGVTPSCQVFKSSGRPHGPQTIVQAIKNSCNYFFFEVGRRIGGEMYEKYATLLGFGQKTGIDLPFESEGKVEGPEHKQKRYENYLSNYLNNSLNITDENIKKEIKGYIYNNPGESTIRKRLKELKKANILPENDTKVVDNIIRYIRESKWQPGNVLNAAIGQGSNSVTPIQLANYISTIINGGTRYKPYLVDRVVGYDGTVKLENKPQEIEKLNFDPVNVEWIKKGMYAVTNEQGGTARRAFVGSKSIVGGKTGTAEAGKGLDDHAWFVAFAPYDKPQIVVAVLIFQGGHGNYPAPVARAIIDQYLTPEHTNDTILPENDIIP